MKVIVYHASYGCETGCCGHVVLMGENPDPYAFADSGQEEFEFDHPYGQNPRKFAERLVRNAFGEDHVKDLDWENCRIVDSD